MTMENMDPTRKLFHLFPFVALPAIFNLKPKDIYEQLSGPDGTEEINRLWKTLGSELKINVPGRLSRYEHSLSSGHKLIIISLPPPSLASEVYSIGMVFAVKRSIFRSSVTAQHYFTMELNANKQNPNYFFYELQNQREHNCYGPMRDCRLETFIGAIQEIMSMQVELEVNYQGGMDTFKHDAYQAVANLREPFMGSIYKELLISGGDMCLPMLYSRMSDPDSEYYLLVGKIMLSILEKRSNLWLH